MKTYEYEKLLKSIFDQVKAEILETNKLFINQEGKNANIMCITITRNMIHIKKSLFQNLTEFLRLQYIKFHILN